MQFWICGDKGPGHCSMELSYLLASREITGFKRVFMRHTKVKFPNVI